jgi:hypothetical protein
VGAHVLSNKITCEQNVVVDKDQYLSGSVPDPHIACGGGPKSPVGLPQVAQSGEVRAKWRNNPLGVDRGPVIADNNLM